MSFYIILSYKWPKRYFRQRFICKERSLVDQVYRIVIKKIIGEFSSQYVNNVSVNLPSSTKYFSDSSWFKRLIWQLGHHQIIKIWIRQSIVSVMRGDVVALLIGRVCCRGNNPITFPLHKSITTPLIYTIVHLECSLLVR